MDRGSKISFSKIPIYNLLAFTQQLLLLLPMLLSRKKH
jgi:hypothetical protein